MPELTVIPGSWPPWRGASQLTSADPTKAKELGPGLAPLAPVALVA
jgi:hypothetical protein